MGGKDMGSSTGCIPLLFPGVLMVFTLAQNMVARSNFLL